MSKNFETNKLLYFAMEKEICTSAKKKCANGGGGTPKMLLIKLLIFPGWVCKQQAPCEIAT